MRNGSVSTACLCFALALCPAVAQGDPTPVSVEAPVTPSATPLEGGVELQWWVIDLGGGVSRFEGLVLSGAIADLSEEPFAVLRGFDSPAPVETSPPVGGLAGTPVTEFSLAPISPNPNRGAARMSWTLPVQSSVRLTVHDVQGREIELLADGLYPPGRHDVAWSGGERGRVAAGIYYVRLKAQERVMVRRMVVIR